MKKYSIEFRPMGKKARYPAGQSLIDCCRLEQLSIASACGGRGKCHSCKVRIEKGISTAPTRNELKILSPGELVGGWRLACQVRLSGDIVVYLPGGEGLSSSPAFKERLLAKIMPGAAEGCHGLGVAIDLGTTRVAGYLLDLADGRILGSLATANPQAVYGDDVISRITYAMGSPAGSGILKKAAAAAIDGLVIDLVAKHGRKTREIKEAAVCGNTAMHHLALGLPVSQLARAPYLPWVREAVNVPAKELGLKSATGAGVYFLPNIGGFVGGDHLAVLMATGAAKMRLVTLVIDIGTNTEISLVAGGSVTSVSCASGPAFEGGHIKSGMKASAGAIDRISICDGIVKYRTIGGGRPAGICGSGMLDAMAQMAGAGVIDPGGRMEKGHPLVSIYGGQLQVLVAGAEESLAGENIVITQGDVRELQLAKAAISTGISVLLKSAGISAADVKRVIVAGTFGNYIDIKSAISIGMLPDLPDPSFIQVGNAAGAGACLALVSTAARQNAEEMARRVNYLELADRPDFMELYVDALKFIHNSGGESVRIA